MREIYSPNVGTSSPNKLDRVPKAKWDYAKELRKNATPSEKLLWQYLRKNQLGARFQRQRIVLGYIPDFWCPTYSLIVELDGIFHKDRKAQDAERDRKLASHGIRTLRIRSYRVFSDIHNVLREIRECMTLEEV